MQSGKQASGWCSYLRNDVLVWLVRMDESLRCHPISAKENGITKEEIAEIVTHAAFYCGWPKAWAVFRMAKEVWTDEETLPWRFPENIQAMNGRSR